MNLNPKNATMAESPFRHITCRQEAGVLVIRFTDQQLQSDLVMEELRQELLTVLAQSDLSKLVLDFQGVKYLSSAAFRPLLSLYRKSQERGGRMVFCNLTSEIQEMFVVTRLISTSRSSTAPFEMAKDLSEAIARLKHHTSRLEQGVLVVTLTESRLHGEELAESLSQSLLAAVQEAAAKHVILDFRQVEAISTPCMRPLLNLRSHLKQSGGRVVLCNLAPLVAEVLTVTRLISGGKAGAVPFESAADVPAALALFQQ
jgi:anti-anti-sigma factor